MEITYNGKKYCFSAKSGVALAAKAAYGNNAISMSEEDVTVAEIQCMLAPKTKAVAAEFNKEILPLDSVLKQNGELAFITVKDARAKKIMLATAAFAWDMARFCFYKDAKHYEQRITDEAAVLAYFVSERIDIADLQALCADAEKIMARNSEIEPVLLSTEDAKQYYLKHGEWYLLDQLIAEDSDYPYKFWRTDDYLARREDYSVMCAPEFIKKIVLKEAKYYQKQDKLLLEINLDIVKNHSF